MQYDRIERIRTEVVAAVSKLTCVRRIESFGSVAAGSCDQWSDLDLLISCERPETTAWLAAAAIRASKPVAFYRTFSDKSQPSGRYWFCGESPFHRLDVSFNSLEDHAEACAHGVRPGHPVEIRTEYVARHPPDHAADARTFSSAHPLAISSNETDTGRLLYNYLESAKNQLRGWPVGRSIFEIREALLQSVSQVPMMAGGGDIISFVASVDDFIQRELRKVCQEPIL